MLDLNITPDPQQPSSGPSRTAAPEVSSQGEFDFARRHNGSTAGEIAQMLSELGYGSLGQLIDDIIPEPIRLKQPLNLPQPLTEAAALQKLRAIAQQNQVFRSFLGLGYHDCITPPVIQRNILENPGWYTAYTPYQAEIAQGRFWKLSSISKPW